MKKKWSLCSVLLLLLLMLVGCFGGAAFVEHDSYYYDNDDEVYVHERPPEMRVEVISDRPGEDYVWIDGCWVWHNQWVWRSGSWNRRPHQTSVWVHSNWSNEHDGWKYHRGRWKD